MIKTVKDPKKIVTAAALLVCCLTAGLVLWGCGNTTLSGADASGAGGFSGGGTIIAGVGTGGTGVIKSSLAASPSGRCGLIGAVVFLDTNSNRQHDPDEPFAYTDQNGAYTIQVSQADLAAYPLLVQAVAGSTIDMATGQTVSSGYIAPLDQQ